MKELLKNRAVAAALCVVMVLLGIVAGVRGPFGDMKEDALVYFDGTQDIIGIKQDLSDKVNTAYSLVSVAKRYLDENDVLMTSLTSACDKVEDADDPSDAFVADKSMNECYYALKDKLASLSMKKADIDWNYSLLADYESSSKIIANSPYNEYAREINEEMSKFPANIFTKITFVSEMAVFE